MLPIPAKVPGRLLKISFVTGHFYTNTLFDNLSYKQRKTFVFIVSMASSLMVLPQLIS